ncbi:DUF1396 domain-containing protein [Streptomyces sp. NPDC002004]
MGLSVRVPGARGAGLAALLLTGGAVGCSAGAADPSQDMAPAAAVAKAAKKTEEITSLRYRMTGRVPEQGRLRAEASISMKPPAMSMKAAALDGPDHAETEIRLVGGSLYVGGGDEAAKSTDGKRWLKFDLSGKARTHGGFRLDTTKMRDGVQRNPAQESTFLTGSKDVRKVGAETVQGVRTTHYAGTVTVDALRASLKGKDRATREAREKSLQQYEKLGVDRLTMDMWIDPGDHVKQFRVRGDADRGRLDLTMTFLDWNKPVTIKAPPAGRTMDLAKKLQDAQAG